MAYTVIIGDKFSGPLSRKDGIRTRAEALAHAKEELKDYMTRGDVLQWRQCERGNLLGEIVDAYGDAADVGAIIKEVK